MAEQENDFELPDVIFANGKIGSNGISCLDYREYKNNPLYVKYTYFTERLEKNNNFSESEKEKIMNEIFSNIF